MKFLILLLAILSVSCGKQPMPWDKQVVYVQSVAPAEPEMYSYELEGDNCATGFHSYASFGEVCSSLLNHQLNNYCAQDERLELYDTNCQDQV